MKHCSLCLLFISLMLSTAFGYQISDDAKLVGVSLLHAEKPGSSLNDGPAMPVAGARFKDGWVNVLVLNGNYYQMGLQHGQLMKKEILIAYEEMIEKTFIASGAATFDLLKEIIFDNTWPAISKRQKMVFQGIADGCGLPVEKIFLLDQTDYIIQLAVVGMLNNPTVMDIPNFSCSFIGAWNNFSDDGNLVLGRNFDWFAQFKAFHDLITVVVLNPTDGSESVANITYPGWVNVITGMNSAGQFIELNSGVGAMGIVLYKDRSRMINEMFEILLDADSFESVQHRIALTRADFPNIINIANGTYAESMENDPFLTRARDPDFDGMIVATNNFLLPSWGVEIHEGPDYSLTRRNHLLELGLKYKGMINENGMMYIMDQPLQYQNGTLANGATIYQYPAKNMPLLTVMSVVANPKKRTMWLRVPDINDWQEVDLNGYFNQAAVDNKILEYLKDLSYRETF